MFLTIATTFMAGLLLSADSFADNTDVVDQINITVPVSCTMSGTGMTSHNAEIANGNYNSSIGETVIKAFCNDSEGFAIYAIGYTDDTDGKNVLTSSTLGSTYDIVTGTATAPVSGVDTSQWAMKLSTITSPVPTYPIIIAGSTDDTEKEQGDLDYSDFEEVPDDYTKVAYRNSSTDINPAGQSTAEGSTLKTTYQAYISKTQPAGTYTGQVKYTLVHPADAAAPEKPKSIATATTMQEVGICPDSLVTEQVYTLTDTRDNQSYKVAKLADGKCWMVENLNIAGGTALSSEDTDFDSNYTLPTTNGWTVSNNELILPASEVKKENDTSLVRTAFNQANYAYVFNSGNKTNCGGYGQYSLPCYSYYSWDTATLGSGRNLSNSEYPPYSLCPKGWRLPTSGGQSNNEWKQGDIYSLATAYGANLENSVMDSSTATSSNFFTNAGPGTIPNFLLGGGYLYKYFGGEDQDIPGGWAGAYWSAREAFRFSSSFIIASESLNKSYGLSVRCVLKTE